MKIDTSAPKDWKKFVQDIAPLGIEKLSLKHCELTSWEFPNIILTLDPSQSPFISSERIASLSAKIKHHYKCENIDLKIVTGDNPKKDILEEIKSRIELKKMLDNVYI